MSEWDPPVADGGARCGFPLDVFEARRSRVMDRLGSGALLLPASPILHRSGDSEVRYRASPELFYLTGFSEPDALLLLRGFADEERCILFVRDRDERAERWNGPRAGPERARLWTGVEDVRPIGKLDAALPPLLSGAEQVYVRLGEHGLLERCVLEAMRSARRKGARTGIGPRGVLDPGLLLDDLRLRKDSHELLALREAVSRTVEGFRRGLARVAPGVGEWEVEATVESTFRTLGATGPAFPTIVASGANACVLHYVDNVRRMDAGELVLVDAGAERRMYGGDLTRTVPVGGRFTPEQRDVYEIVEAARQAAVASIAPGLPVDRVHSAAVEVLVSGLRALGILRGPSEQLIEEREYEPYFPHQTSHWLGLDTHDVGDYAQNGVSRLLEPGMVLTVEPGLYFEPRHAEPSGAAAFHGIGVRIEDDVLVGSEAAEVLSGDLPTDPDSVEALVGAGREPGP